MVLFSNLWKFLKLSGWVKFFFKYFENVMVGNVFILVIIWKFFEIVGLNKNFYQIFWKYQIMESFYSLSYLKIFEIVGLGKKFFSKFFENINLGNGFFLKLVSNFLKMLAKNFHQIFWKRQAEDCFYSQSYLIIFEIIR